MWPARLWRKTLVKETAVSVAIAVLSTVVLLRWDSRPHWLDSVTFVGYYLGTAVSGNVHSPNRLVAWVVIGTILFVPIWTAIAMIGLAYRDLRDDGAEGR
jgi:hypothetical protein